jgi:hypothetical protein
MLLKKLCKVNRGNFGKTESMSLAKESYKKGQIFCQTSFYKKRRRGYGLLIKFWPNDNIKFSTNLLCIEFKLNFS